MILDVDIGNSRVKWRQLSECGSLLGGGACNGVDELVAALDACGEPIERARVSCVSQDQQLEQLASWLRYERGVTCELARVTATAVGISNAYDCPEQLGIDRWLAIIGAHSLVTEPYVVVDAGSALTIDVVISGGRHLGGYIIPGLTATADALQRKTARVCFDSMVCADSLAIGRNTQQAVSHGILRSQVTLVEAVVQELAASEEKTHPSEVKVVVTGGDAPVLARYLSMPCAVLNDLVFKGIEILMP